jgi:hypothetical protein
LEQKIIKTNNKIKTTKSQPLTEKNTNMDTQNKKVAK